MAGDLCLTAAFLSLSLDFIKDLSSFVIHGEFVSETLISLSGACFSIIAENTDDHSLIITLMSLDLLTTFSQQIPATSAKCLLIKTFHNSGIDHPMASTNSCVQFPFTKDHIMVAQRLSERYFMYPRI